MKSRPLLLISALAALLSGPSFLAAGSGAPAPLDPSLFPPALFPGINKIPQADLWLDGLAKRYPHRVLTHTADLKISPSKAPFVTALEKGITYIRVYNLQSALPAIESHRSGAGLVLDLRSVHADLESSLRLAALLGTGTPLDFDILGQFAAGKKSPLTATPDGKRPEKLAVVVLTNGETAGPIEAVLDGLQSRKAIIGVGLPTMGLTGSFRPVPDHPEYSVIDGEIRPADGKSLVGTGFKPEIAVETTAKADATAYAAFTDAASLKMLINPPISKQRFDENSLIQDFQKENGPDAAIGDTSDETAAVTPSPSNAKPVPPDLILKKGQAIMEALVALQKIHPQ